MAVLPDLVTALRYFKLEGEYATAPVPTANTPTNGSLLGMLRYLGGGISDEFEEAGAALIEWAQRKGVK
jgi:hypothetical protein